MHPFHARAVDKDLVFRSRQRQVGNLVRIELEGHVALRGAGAVDLIEVRAQRRAHDIQIAAQDAVLIQTRDRIQRRADLSDESFGARRRAHRGARLEIRLKQAHEVPGNSRIRRKRALHVDLAERHTRLQQIAAICAQHHDLARGKPRCEQQTVEAVVLNLPAPHRGERFFECRLDARNVDAQRVAVLELEILDPGRTALGPCNLIGAFSDDAQAKILQHRQEVGYRHRHAELHDLQMHSLGNLARRAMQVEARGLRLGAQRFQVLQILERVGGRDLFLIGERKRVPVAVRECEHRRLVMRRDESGAQPVRPGRRRLGNALLDAGKVDFAPIVRVGADDHVHACMIGVGDLHLRFNVAATETLEHDLFDALAHLSAVAIARYVDEERIEALKRIAPGEEAHGAPLVQVDDAARNADQILHRRLEEFVAGIGFEHVQHGFGVVALRVESKVADHALDLLAQHRDFARAELIGGRRPQAEKAMFAGHFAARAEALHADIVEIGRAMHARHGIGFRQDEELALARPCAQLSAQDDRACLAAAQDT